MSLALVSYSRLHGVEPSTDVRDFETLQGEGICGVIDQHKIHVGNGRLAVRLGWVTDVPNTWNSQGSTVGYVGVDEQLVGIFNVADQIRPEAAEAIMHLKKAQAKTVIVGGEGGWHFGYNYTNWASNAGRFYVNDTLEKSNCLRTLSLHFAYQDQIKMQAERDEKQLVADSNMDVLTPENVSPELVKELLPEALVWASLHGLVVGDRAVKRSGQIPGVGLVHAPFALLPMPFPEGCWRQACDLAPLFNELVDRVSMDGDFLQKSLSRTQRVDAFTARLLNIHSRILEDNVKQEIRLGLHRSDYMLDMATGELLQVELNTISSSFAGLGCLVSQLHRNKDDVILNNQSGYLMRTKVSSSNEGGVAAGFAVVDSLYLA